MLLLLSQQFMGTSSLAFLQQKQVTFSLFRQQPSRVWQLHPTISSSSYKPWLGNHYNRRTFLLHLQQQQRRWQTTKTTWSSLYSSYSSSSSSLSSTETFQPTTTTMTNNSQTNKKKYKIAIVGAGAVGSYYGARLWEAGHDVQFYTRTKPKDSLAVVPETTRTKTTTMNENNENHNGTDGSSNHKKKKNNNDDDGTTGTTDHTGLYVSSIEGDIYIPTKDWHVFNDTTKMQIADWIVVALKSSSLDAIPNLIVPLFRQDCTTRVLVIMNGLIEDDLIQLLQAKTTKKKKEEDGLLQPNTTTTTGAAATEPHHPKQQQQQQLSCCKALYGGMALICSNRLSSHRIDHSYAGLLSAGVATSTSTTTRTTRTTTSSSLGMKHKDDNDDNHEENHDNDNDDEIAFRKLFVGTKVPITYESNLLRGRWKKMVWNLPFNGISVAMGGITVDQIVQDPGLRQLAIHIMDETILIANTELQHIYGDSNNNKNNNDDDDNNPSNVSWQPLGNVEKEQMMNLSDNMGPYKTSTMLDLTNRRAMEVQYMFREPLQRAQRLGIPVPYLQTIVTLIEAYQRKYNL